MLQKVVCQAYQVDRLIGEAEAEQMGPAEEVLVSYGDKKLTMRHIEYLQPKADAGTIKKSLIGGLRRSCWRPTRSSEELLRTRL